MVTLSGIYTKLIFFFFKRLIFHELYELEYKLCKNESYAARGLLCEVLQEIDYVDRAFNNYRITPAGPLYALGSCTVYKG